jgi:hypothetical protein
MDIAGCRLARRRSARLHEFITFSSYNDSAYDFTGSNALLNIPHTADSSVIQFFASGAGWQGGTDESFGLDKRQTPSRLDGINRNYWRRPCRKGRIGWPGHASARIDPLPVAAKSLAAVPDWRPRVTAPGFRGLP